MVRWEGIGPSTSGLKGPRSTTELPARIRGDIITLLKILGKAFLLKVWLFLKKIVNY